MVGLIVALYLTVVVANLGGFLDELLRAQIEQQVAFEVASSPTLSQASDEVKRAYIERRIEQLEKALGLDKPFFPDRSLIYLWKLLTLDLGRSFFITAASGSTRVYDIIMERLPNTVLLISLGTVLSALVGIMVGTYLSKKPLTRQDRVVVPFSITTFVIPTWFFGIIFILFFSYYLGLVPSGGMYSPNPPEDPLGRTADLLYHLALPLATWVFSNFGIWAYTTRNLLIQIAHEDFVLAARAKGLPESVISRRYILRVAMPPIVTSLSLSIIASIGGAIITETVFNWPGTGQLYYLAIQLGDAPVIIGLTAIYAYMLIMTVLILEILYAVLDPRIRVSR